MWLLVKGEYEILGKEKMRHQAPQVLHLLKRGTNLCPS